MKIYTPNTKETANAVKELARAYNEKKVVTTYLVDLKGMLFLGVDAFERMLRCSEAISRTAQLNEALRNLNLTQVDTEIFYTVMQTILEDTALMDRDVEKYFETAKALDRYSENLWTLGIDFRPHTSLSMYVTGYYDTEKTSIFMNYFAEYCNGVLNFDDFLEEYRNAVNNIEDEDED